MFRDVQGNTALRDALVGMIDSGRIPHAMLLHENDGGGAMPLVLAFLQYLYCPHRHDGDACGECPACNKVGKLIHPDIHFVYPITGGTKSTTDKPTSETYVRTWRDLVLANPCFTENGLYEALGIENKSCAIAVAEAKAILDTLSLSGVEGGWRTVCLYLPEKMHPAAANMLLKMVEEPPAETLFLFITHAPERVLTTISSRCLPLRVLPPAEQPSVAADAGLKDLFADLMDALVRRDLMAALETGEAMAALESREKQKAFCKFAGEGVRTLFLIQQGLPGLAAVAEEDRPFYEGMAGRCRKTFPRAALGHIDRAQMLIERNVNQKILFCDLVDRLYSAI